MKFKEELAGQDETGRRGDPLLSSFRRRISEDTL